jgi:hypothetical protein
VLGGAVTTERVVSYRIHAALDAVSHRVHGTETIEWRNASTTPATDLYLHAYLNAFRDPTTRFLRFSPAARRSATSTEAPGSLRIERLRAHELGDLDLLPRIAQHSPGDPDDATDLRVELPVPIAPGATLNLDVEFTATLPALVERAGFSGSFHAIAQWFPKLARRTADGQWLHYSYDALAEFSSDFGNYDVTLDVPATFIVAAPGEAERVASESGRRRERYCITDVHDFAWFAWDRFVTTEAKFGDVSVRLYASPEQSENLHQTLESVKFGLDYYGSQLFPYPYRHLTVVHPPDNARAAGGMEYPQLITTGGPWFLAHTGLNAIAALTLHELAHQWFYGVVASDEYRFPVLDEGLTSWLEAEALEKLFGRASLFKSPWVDISEAAIRHQVARQFTRRGPLALPATEFGDFDSLAGRVYARFPTLLNTIGAVYGETKLHAAIAIFARRYRFGHPDVNDFLDTMRQSLDPAASTALATSLLSDGWVDYGVRRLTTSPTSHGQYDNRVQLERRGNLDFPIEMLVRFENGHEARRYLASVASNEWIAWPYTSPIKSVTLDPDHRISIDDDLSNQSKGVSPSSMRVGLWLHGLLSAWWSLGWP